MNTTTNFDAMNKNELRAACKEHGVKNYGAMNNDGMRAALKAAVTPVVEEVVETPVVEEAPVVAEPQTASDVFASMFGAAPVVTANAPTTRVVDGKRVEIRQTSTRVGGSKVAPAPVLPQVSRKGYKIQADREVQNGVKHPSEGTLCAKIWEYLDNNLSTRAADLSNVADSNLWDRTTVSCQFYAWRKFNGIKGRQAK